MDFGRDPALALDEVDFVLPQLEPRSVAALAASTPILTTPLRVGAPAWAVPAWVGDLYPRGASRADWLKHYAARFDTVELNATFYAIPTRARCAAWAEAVRENTAFRFCPKAPRALSHAPGLRPAAADVRAFVHAVEGFGEHLGPSLLQLHEAVGPSRLPEIVRLLDALPRALPLALEVRHPGFFAECTLAAPLFEALASRAVGLWSRTSRGGAMCVTSACRRRPSSFAWSATACTRPTPCAHGLGRRACSNCGPEGYARAISSFTSPTTQTR